MSFLEGFLLLVLTIEVAVVAAAVVSLRILWLIFITVGLCDMGWGGGEALVLGAGPHPGGRNDRGDSLQGHSQWQAPQVPFPGGGGVNVRTVPGGRRPGGQV